MLAAAILAAVAAATPAAAPGAAGDEHVPAMHTVVLGPREMFRLAQIAEAKSDLRIAVTIYEALERNPSSDVRAEARFRHAKLLLAQKRSRDAAIILRRLIDEKPDATVARLELAHALQLIGDPSGALRELRAVQAQGLPPAVARLVDRYSEALRAQRPFGGSFEIALAPDSNINRATRSDTLGTIFGDFDIGGDSRARSGTGAALQGQAFRRLPLGSGDQTLLVRLSGSADLYRQTEFNDIAVDLAGGPELRLGRNQVNLEVGATQRWFGQKPFMRSERLGATWTRPIGSRMQVRLSATGALIDNQFNHLQDGKSYSGEVEFERALTPTTGIGLNVALNRQSLKDPGYSTTGWRGGLIAWHDIGRMTFTAEADYGRLNADDRLLLFPDKRSDRYSRLSLGATFRQLQFRGFAPLARFSIERNRSTVELYDFRRTRSEIGFVRAF